MVYKNLSFNFDLMYNKILKGHKFVCAKEEFLPLNILLPTKALSKLIGNWFCTQIIFKNSEKSVFIKKYTVYILFVLGVFE